MRDHRRLKAFEHVDHLVIEVYRETRAFPREELFGLTSQMRRAAVSVAANIVEGCPRSTEREYLHFLNIAMGSLRELGYYIGLAGRLEYLKPEATARLGNRYEEAARTLSGLIHSLGSDT